MEEGERKEEGGKEKRKKIKEGKKECKSESMLKLRFVVYPTPKTTIFLSTTTVLIKIFPTVV